MSRQYTPSDFRHSVNSGMSKGIASAEFYIKSLAEQFGQDDAANLYCNSKSVKWAAALKQARMDFTFHQKGMDVLEVDDMEIDQGTKIDKGAYAEYEAIIGTNDKDWDGDIVDPMGYDFDMKSPVLWMHAHGMPLGSIKSIVERDEKKARCRFKVADTPLGRDAVKLMQVGALRKSIGFKPKANMFKPLGFKKDKDGKEVPSGWHVKGCHILENSLVSVPANMNTEVLSVDVRKSFEKQFDAIRTIASRKELEDERLRLWGKSILDGRSTAVRGWSPDAATVEKIAEAVSEKMLQKSEATKEVPSNETLSTDISDLKTQKYYGVEGYMPASMEERMDKLQKCISNYCRNNPEKFGSRDSCYCYPFATYSEFAYVACHDYSRSSRKYFQFNYTVEDGGDCKITDVSEISITPMVSQVNGEEKAAQPDGGMMTKLEEVEKAFKKKMASLSDAEYSLNEVDMSRKEAISLIRKGVGILLVGDHNDQEVVAELHQAAGSLKRLQNVKQLRAVGLVS